MTDENNYKIKMFYYYYCDVGDTRFITSDRTFCYTVYTICDIVPDRGDRKTTICCLI